MRDRINQLITNIEQARISVNEHNIVKFVAVSKYSTTQDIQDVLNIGHRAFGENKVQDYVSKKQELEELPIEWHFIGRLQKNKINKLLEHKPSLFHSLDSIELAQAINERLKSQNKTLNTLIQINSAKEQQKAGFMPDVAKEAYLQIQEQCPNIKLKGVMSIGALSDDEQEVKKSFEITKNIFDELDNAKICSMGMSSDYELAIKCGANLLRVGSSIFS